MLVMMEMGSGGWRSRILGGLRHVGRHGWLFSAVNAGRRFTLLDEPLRGVTPQAEAIEQTDALPSPPSPTSP